MVWCIALFQNLFKNHKCSYYYTTGQNCLFYNWWKILGMKNVWFHIIFHQMYRVALFLKMWSCHSYVQFSELKKWGSIFQSEKNKGEQRTEE